MVSLKTVSSIQCILCRNQVLYSESEHSNAVKFYLKDVKLAANYEKRNRKRTDELSVLLKRDHFM